MNTKTIQFKTEVTNGTITRIGRSVIMQPKTTFKGGSVKWFDDNRLIRKPVSASR